MPLQDPASVIPAQAGIQIMFEKTMLSWRHKNYFSKV